ncbi:MAG: glycosyltransferase [Muribaculaceae bacterium]|nr:glycosyltransferase [Muribaculaceae bacterium]
MNSTADYAFTIVVPVYNEEDNLLRVEERLKEYMAKCPLKAAVLLVDDKSTDSSLAMIKDICRRNQDFHYLAMDRNGSLTAVMKAAFTYIESPYIGYIDADLQTDPDDFDLLLPDLPQHGLSMGIRARRTDSKFRVWQSKIANSFRRRMTGDSALDSACPLKVFRADVAKNYPFFTGMHRFFPALTALQGETYAQHPVRHYPRVAGKAKFNMRNRVFVAFIDCFALRWMRSRNITNHVAESDL